MNYNMKEKISGMALITFCLLFLYSCSENARHPTLVINNTADSPIIVAELKKDDVTDSIIYNEVFNSIQIDPGRLDQLSAPGNLKSYPDSFKLNILILNRDSLDVFRRKKKVKGILNRSLIKRLILQINLIKDPLDTVYITDKMPNT